MPIVNMLVFANYAHFSKKMQKIKTLLDSGFSAVDSGFQFNGFHSLSVGRGFWIQNVSGILDSKARDSGFNNENFPDLGIRIPLHGASKRAKEFLK